MKRHISYTRLINLLTESLLAWEGEEDSVQEEHRALILRLRKTLKALEGKS